MVVLHAVMKMHSTDCFYLRPVVKLNSKLHGWFDRTMMEKPRRRRTVMSSLYIVPLTSALLNLPKGKSLGLSKPATNS